MKENKVQFWAFGTTAGSWLLGGLVALRSFSELLRNSDTFLPISKYIFFLILFSKYPSSSQSFGLRSFIPLILFFVQLHSAWPRPLHLPQRRFSIWGQGQGWSLSLVFFWCPSPRQTTKAPRLLRDTFRPFSKPRAHSQGHSNRPLRIH